MNKAYKPLIEAHRGASGYEVDNTIKAFDKAIELNSDTIELDIRKTKDNHIIVFHDPTFKGKLIIDYTYDELLSSSLESGFKVPLLTDVLIKYKSKILLDIETEYSSSVTSFMKKK